jgi:superfamily II DNA/RNA helicase
VPGPKRKDLLRRFREDADCRLFLSTDAGGVGLNLQHASVVVNLDQPWNPAVLEQRIGRVHRLGQHRPVRVVHLISQGTIEEGMLNLLGFKKAVFAGVLDGGQDEVFLGGTRLKQFMESVDKATASIPRPMPLQRPDGDGEEAERTPSERRRRPRLERDRDQAEPPRQPERPASDALWTDLVTAGMSLLDKLAQAFAKGGSGPESGEGERPPLRLHSDLIVHDQPGAEPYLRLPLPKPEVVEKITGLLSALLER